MTPRPTINYVIDSLKNHRGTTTYSGSCAVGAALEGAVGIMPNNSKDSDTITHDMKSTEGKCDVTLFSRSPERGDTYAIVLKYGYQDRKNRRSFMKDIKATSPELYCHADNEGVGVYDAETNEEICFWSHEHCQPGYDKVSNVLKIFTKSKKSTGEYSVEGLTTYENFSLNKFIELINAGAISISPRRYFTSNTKNSSTNRYPSRDRGCAFRISQKYFSQLYASKTEHY
jgi:hypothetical protein